MPSLFLGKIGDNNNIYEVHAFTKNLPFREFTTSEISDKGLFDKMIHDRFELLEKGQAIYCTAVNPIIEKQIEINPHDVRPGTVHIVSIDGKGEIHSALSVAVDIGEKINGENVGVPLENRWQQNNYPAGASLNPFREKYIKLNYREDRKIKPWEMAELYRHFKKNGQQESIVSRLGTYIGCYHLMYWEAVKKELTPTWLWVFDAIPPYFNLYRYAGAAVLRDLTIQNYPRLISPPLDRIKKVRLNGNNYYQYENEIISRMVEVPFVRHSNGTLETTRKEVPFLDGLVDINRIYQSIRKCPILLTKLNYEGFTTSDRIKLRLTLAILSEKEFNNRNGLKKFLIKLIQNVAEKKMQIQSLDF